MYFDFIEKVPCEGTKSKNPFAFRYYDADRVVMGKPMSEHLNFAMSWWHTLGADGVDMFGKGTADKTFGCEPATMEHARAKVDAGFEFMEKLGIPYFCFHDVDLVPEADDINETNKRLDEISDYILEKMQATGIKCLWGTANMFSNPRFMNGAGSTNSAEVYCFAAAQVRFGGRCFATCSHFLCGLHCLLRARLSVRQSLPLWEQGFMKVFRQPVRQW